jgi:hypothetical protein
MLRFLSRENLVPKLLMPLLCFAFRVLQGGHARETDSSKLIDVFCVLNLTQGLQKSPKKSLLTDALIQF